MNEITQLVLWAVMLVWAMGSFFYFHRAGYKEGQIDYYNGKIKWKLLKDENGETTWQKNG